MSKTIGLNSMTAKKPEDRAGHEPQQRPPRVKLMGQLKLNFPNYQFSREEFFYHIFPDIDGKVQQAEAAYYEKCTYLDGKPCIVIDKGIQHFLMRLRMEYHLEAGVAEC